MFGAVYALLGVLGFAMPGLVASILGHPRPGPSGELMPDNLFHIAVGAAFILAGLRTAPAVVARAA